MMVHLAHVLSAGRKLSLEVMNMIKIEDAMELVRRLAYSRAKTMYAMRKYKGKSLIDWAVLWFKMSNDAFFRLYGFNFNPFDYPYLYDIARDIVYGE